VRQLSYLFCLFALKCVTVKAVNFVVTYKKPTNTQFEMHRTPEASCQHFMSLSCILRFSAKDASTNAMSHTLHMSNIDVVCCGLWTTCWQVRWLAVITRWGCSCHRQWCTRVTLSLSHVMFTINSLQVPPLYSSRNLATAAKWR